MDNRFGSSVSIIERILNASDPFLPDVAFSLVDVKNVAEMHVNAIKIDASKNKRFLASSETMSFIEIAKVIKAQYPNRKVNMVKAPNFIIRILGLFDGDIKRVVPILGQRVLINNDQARKGLKIKFIPAKQSILETADYLIKNGFVKN